MREKGYALIRDVARALRVDLRTFRRRLGMDGASPDPVRVVRRGNGRVMRVYARVADLATRLGMDPDELARSLWG